MRFACNSTKWVLQRTPVKAPKCGTYSKGIVLLLVLFLLDFFESQCPYVAQVGLKLLAQAVFLPQPAK